MCARRQARWPRGGHGGAEAAVGGSPPGPFPTICASIGPEPPAGPGRGVRNRKGPGVRGVSGGGGRAGPHAGSPNGGGSSPGLPRLLRVFLGCLPPRHLSPAPGRARGGCGPPPPCPWGRCVAASGLAWLSLELASPAFALSRSKTSLALRRDLDKSCPRLAGNLQQRVRLSVRPSSGCSGPYRRGKRGGVGAGAGQNPDPISTAVFWGACLRRPS